MSSNQGNTQTPLKIHNTGNIKMTGMISEKKLLKEIPCCKSTLKVYLGRAEFSHITRARISKQNFVYKGIDNYDIARLKELMQRNKGILYY